MKENSKLYFPGKRNNRQNRRLLCFYCQIKGPFKDLLEKVDESVEIVTNLSFKCNL